MSFGGRAMHRGEEIQELTQLEELKSDKDGSSFKTETMHDSHISSVANLELKENQDIENPLKGRSATQKYDKPLVTKEVDYEEVANMKLDDIQTQYNDNGDPFKEVTVEAKGGTFKINKNRRGSFNYHLLNNNLSTNNSVNSPHSK